MFKSLKCIIAITSSVYGCLQLVGLGLAGTNATPITEQLLLVLGISCAAGITIALLPKNAFTLVLIAASLPVSYLAFLLVLGAIEDRVLPSLLSVMTLFGIVALVTFPEAIKCICKKRKARQ